MGLKINECFEHYSQHSHYGNVREDKQRQIRINGSSKLSNQSNCLELKT